MPRLNAVTLLDLLRRQATLLKVEDKVSAVALDLDGTIFNNGPRTLRIIYEFLSKNYRDHGRLFVDVLKELTKVPMPYGCNDCLNLFLAECRTRDPLFGFKEVHRAEFVAYWKSTFFADDFQSYDLPEPGAAQFAHSLLSAGIMVVYLTGRDAPNMRHGVVDALYNHGFPLFVPGTQVVLKPDFFMPDVGFKLGVLKTFEQAGVVVQGLIDNEPAIVNTAIDCGVLGVHFVSTCSPNPPALHHSAHQLESFVIHPDDKPHTW